MLVSDDRDRSVVYIARGAPRRWYKQTAEPFGIEDAPTRFGTITYTMQVQSDGTVRGSVALALRQGVAKDEMPVVAIKIRAAEKEKPLQGQLQFDGNGAEMIEWHATNETAVVRFGLLAKFNFTAR